MNRRKFPKQKTAKDAVHIVSQALVSAIPVVGGPAQTLIQLIQPPFQKRAEEFIQQLADDLSKLQEKVSGFKIESIAGNKEFQSTFVQAAQAAVKTTQQEKIKALQAACENAAIGHSPEENIRALFVRYIDELSALHLKILTIFNDPFSFLESMGVPYPGVNGPMIQIKRKKILALAFPEYRKEKDMELLEVVFRDLVDRGLLSKFWVTKKIHGTIGYTPEELVKDARMKLGSRFLKFVTSPLA